MERALKKSEMFEVKGDWGLKGYRAKVRM